MNKVCAFILCVPLTLFVGNRIAMGQAGSAGGTIGKTDKSASGGAGATDLRRSSPKAERRGVSSGIASQSTGRVRAMNLSGVWTCEGRCLRPSGKAQIRQNGTNLEFVNEVGMVSRGRWIDSTSVTAEDWFGLTGKVST